MSKISKLLQKFKEKPETLKYQEIKKVLLHLEFEIINTNGSHVKYKNTICRIDIIIPVHNNDCKKFYKKEVLKILKANKIL